MPGVRTRRWGDLALDSDSVKSRVVLAYCGSGPYRYLSDLLAADPKAWFPWGYRSSQVASDVRERIAPGALVEIWEIDDTRHPTVARPMAVAMLDFVLDAGTYLAMTLRAHEGDPCVSTDEVLRGAGQGHLAFGSATS